MEGLLTHLPVVSVKDLAGYPWNITDCQMGSTGCYHMLLWAFSTSSVSLKWYFVLESQSSMYSCISFGQGTFHRGSSTLQQDGVLPKAERVSSASLYINEDRDSAWLVEDTKKYQLNAPMNKPCLLSLYSDHFSFPENDL